MLTDSRDGIINLTPFFGPVTQNLIQSTCLYASDLRARPTLHNCVLNNKNTSSYRAKSCKAKQTETRGYEESHDIKNAELGVVVPTNQ